MLLFSGVSAPFGSTCAAFVRNPSIKPACIQLQTKKSLQTSCLGVDLCCHGEMSRPAGKSGMWASCWRSVAVCAIEMAATGWACAPYPTHSRFRITPSQATRDDVRHSQNMQVHDLDRYNASSQTLLCSEHRCSCICRCICTHMRMFHGMGICVCFCVGNLHL